MSLTRIVGSWLILGIVMIANGIFRELALKPALGESNAEIVSAVLSVGIILVITRLFFRPLAGARTSALLGVSALMIGLTVAFEFLFGHYVDRKSWSELVANYAIWRGRLWPIVLLALALTPFLWGRWVARAREGSRVQQGGQIRRTEIRDQVAEAQGSVNAAESEEREDQ